jgi:hypothetical protein
VKGFIIIPIAVYISAVNKEGLREATRKAVSFILKNNTIKIGNLPADSSQVSISLWITMFSSEGQDILLCV